jgi:hypothetical protein
MSTLSKRRVSEKPLRIKQRYEAYDDNNKKTAFCHQKLKTIEYIEARL